MRNSVIWWVLMSLGLLAGPVQAQQPPATGPQLLRVVADPWCPYNCEPTSARPGYAIEILRAIFEAPAYELRYEVEPWARALQETHDGSAAIAIAVTREQTFQYQLLINREEIGLSRDCVFVAAGNQLRFHVAADLDGLRQLAIVADYDYAGQIAEWLGRPANKHRIVITRGDRPAEVNARRLASGRVDAVVEDDMVMTHVAQSLGLSARITLAGCQSGQPVYFGFSPQLRNAPQLLEQLDRGMTELRRSKRLAQILARYGLQDWRQEAPEAASAVRTGR